MVYIRARIAWYSRHVDLGVWYIYIRAGVVWYAIHVDLCCLIPVDCGCLEYDTNMSFSPLSILSFCPILSSLLLLILLSFFVSSYKAQYLRVSVEMTLAMFYTCVCPQMIVC